MRTFQEIKDHYQFTEMEAETLTSLKPVVEPHVEQLISDFYHYFEQFPDSAKFLKDETVRSRLAEKHREWLLGMFQGPYDDRYFQRLQRVGYAHVRIGLSAHFVYVGMNFLRLNLLRLLEAGVEPRFREAAVRATEKILDLNLDTIARTYHEEEVRRIFLTFKLDNALIRFARRFTFGLNLLLVIGLIALSLGVVGMFALDVSLIFRGSPERGLVAALGSLLILWLMIELLDAEVDRLQGGAFQLSLFVGVALVAFIRKVLVASLAHESLQVETLYLAGILVLGLIFWLVSRAEARKGD
jgi:uncharacterized membrane protein (DUF373 family)